MATKKNLHITYASLAHENSDSANSADIMKAASRGALVVGFDELTKGRSFRDTMKTAASKYGYRAYYYPDIEEGFLIKNGLTVIGRGRVYVHHAIKHLTPVRYIAFIGVKWNGLELWFHCAHWMNKVANYSGGVGGPGRYNAKYVDLHTKVTDAMIKQVRSHGSKAKQISFFMGDTNIDELGDNKTNDHRMVNYRFRKAGLLTIWDELKVFPGTEGNRTYDIIGSYDPHKICKGYRGRAWSKEHSDHRPISAYYQITVPAAGAVTTGGGSKTTAAKAWWDFNDYTDDTIYDLTRVTDLAEDMENIDPAADEEFISG